MDGDGDGHAQAWAEWHRERTEAWAITTRLTLLGLFMLYPERLVSLLKSVSYAAEIGATAERTTA